MFGCLVLLVSGVAAAALEAPAQYEVKTVGTTSGSIKGHLAAWPENSHVSEYLGIPYAAPPLGALRWAPPQKYKGNQTLLGNRYVSVVPQVMRLISKVWC
jgi:carboxylesterase type B